MKKKTVLLGVAFLCTIACTILMYKHRNQRLQKPKSIPEQAVWINGCNGTNWFELVSLKNDTARFRIYTDEGDLLIDADFAGDSDFGGHITASDWNEHIDFYDGTEIYTNVVDSAGAYHTLKQTAPAFFKAEQ